MIAPLALTTHGSKPTLQTEYTAKDYQTSEYMIAMRDGVKLHTIVIGPKNSLRPEPFLMERSPYGWDGADATRMPPATIKRGYIMVLQDIRGRYGSEGKFVMMRPTIAKSHLKVDEGTDTYDTIDWLLKNVPHNNGKVGILGTSYLGWTALEAAVDPHPALKFAAPAASPMDMFLNDDFHRNGAFRLSYGFEYCYMMETSKKNEQFQFDLPDTYDWYLRLGPLSNANERIFHGKIPTWNGFVAHPTHDSYWTDQSVATLLKTPKVPILNIGGFWDQEDPWGPQETYRLLAKNDPGRLNHIILGPWNHGGWRGTSLDQIDFGKEAGARYSKVLYDALDHYLCGDPTDALPTAEVFVSGRNKWQEFNEWPPKASVPTNLYFRAGSGLSFEKPKTGDSTFDEYRSDPANPVPYRKRPIEATYDPKGSGWYTWQVQDQRFLKGRKDLVTYSSSAMEKPVTVVGSLRANLVASTSGTDSDWVVKVIDQYPNDGSKLAGYQLPLNMEVVRSRFRNGLDKAVPTPANQPETYQIDLHAIAHTFLPGHRIVVQVQSSWFPLIDRNPQKFVPNIYQAKATDFQPADQRIYHSKAHLSAIELPILKDQ